MATLVRRFMTDSFMAPPYSPCNYDPCDYGPFVVCVGDLHSFTVEGGISLIYFKVIVALQLFGGVIIFFRDVLFWNISGVCTCIWNSVYCNISLGAYSQQSMSAEDTRRSRRRLFMTTMIDYVNHKIDEASPNSQKPSTSQAEALVTNQSTEYTNCTSSFSIS